MAEVRIPFCTTAEIPQPFILDETYAEPNGVKSVLFDKSKLKVAGKVDTVDVPNIGPVQMCIFHVVGTIPYLCNAFPIIQSDPVYDVQEQAATFDLTADNSSAACTATATSTPLGWVSAVGCLNVDSPVGGDCTLVSLPEIVSVTVDNFAVANNATSSLKPTCSDETSAVVEENKSVIKWRGCFVIKTT